MLKRRDFQFHNWNILTLFNYCGYEKSLSIKVLQSKSVPPAPVRVITRSASIKVKHARCGLVPDPARPGRFIAAGGVIFYLLESE